MENNEICKNVKELLPSFVCNETNEQENAMITEHINSCPECMAEYEMLLCMENALDTASYQAPPELHEHIMKKIRKEAQKNKKHKNILRVSLSFAATMAAAIAIVLVIPRLITGNIGNKDEMENENCPEYQISDKTYSFEKEIFDENDNDKGTYIPLSNQNIEQFAGTWILILKNEGEIKITINQDRSVVMCKTNKMGEKIYYDGMLEISTNNSVLTQSDGEDYFKATVEMFKKDGKLYINIVNGTLPLSMDSGDI